VVSAEVTVDATVTPTVISLGNDATLTFRVKGTRKASPPTLPDMPDFYVYDAGTSQNFSFINGRMSATIDFRFTLTPQKEGTFTVPAIEYEHSGKVFTTTPISIEVTAATSAIPSPGAPPAGQGTSSDGETESLFIRATLERDTVYVNQQVTWTLGYYTDGRIALLRSPNYAPPSAEGFWVEDLPPQHKYYTAIEGRQYLVNEIKRGYFPISPGIYTIGQARVDVVLDDGQRRGLLDDFFSRRSGFGKQHTLLTDERTVTVLPLPLRGKPSGFSGVVASDLKISIAAEKQVAQVGEPINVSLEISGTGNIKTVVPPALPESEHYKIYESGSSSDTFKKNYVVTGRKKYDYVIIPQEEGKWSLPVVELSYFDPIEKQYRVARSMAVPLDIQPGAKEDGRTVIYAGGGDDFEVINRDIRFIHSVPATIAFGSVHWYRSPVFLGLQFVPMLAVVLALFAERRRRRFADDIVFARASRALREADRKMESARKCFEARDNEGGFAILTSALHGYFADKMNVSAAGLTSAGIGVFLTDTGVADEEKAGLEAVLSACDQARYAAGSVSHDGAVETVARARALLSAVEKVERR